MDLLRFYGLKPTTLLDVNQSDEMRDVALSAWSDLSAVAPIFIIIMVAGGLGLAAYYYTAYNNQPGRHYTPKHWAIFYAINIIGVLILTWLVAWLAQKDYGINGLGDIRGRLVACNTLYAIGLYLIVSLIWCNTSLKTNAYRLLKIK